MVKCFYIHSEFRNRVNRFNISEDTYPTAEKIDSVVNYAKEVWYNNRIKNIEIDANAREELRNFEKSNVKLDLIDKGDFVIAKLPEDYYQKNYFKVKATKDVCPDCEKFLTPVTVKGGDFNYAIKDPDRKSSFEFEEILYDEKQDGVYFYLNRCCKILQINLDYFIKIKDIQCPSMLKGLDYIKPNGSIAKRNIGLPDFNLNSLNEILDIAAYTFLTRVNDVPEVTLQFNLIKNKYKL